MEVPENIYTFFSSYGSKSSRQHLAQATSSTAIRIFETSNLWREGARYSREPVGRLSMGNCLTHPTLANGWSRSLFQWHISA